MSKRITFREYAQRLREFILRHSHDRTSETACPSASSENEFNALALALFVLQFDHVLPYQRFCRARGKTLQTVTGWQEIPALPTVAFKEYEVTTLPVAERAAVFHSSGTTRHRPSRHFHNAESLELYEASLSPWFQQHLLAGLDRAVTHAAADHIRKPTFIALTPAFCMAPRSSLVHMIDAVCRQFGSTDSAFTGRLETDGTWNLEMDETLHALEKSISGNRAVVLLGTAFSFVHLLEHLEERGFSCALVAGSSALETGGYKGRARELSKAELHRRITKYLGVPETHIVCEYGMSELSSQAYDRAVGPPNPRASTLDSRRVVGIFRFPPWARVRVISPETGQEVAEGETGLIQVFDLANVRSVLAIQTEDLGVRRGDGFELRGRVATAQPRGCSLMFSDEIETGPARRFQFSAGI